jgi:hypothetical protein
MEEIRIRDSGWKKFRSRIRDKHPGSATMVGRKLFIPISKGESGKLLTIKKNQKIF